jgi:hypothetical protein
MKGPNPPDHRLVAGFRGGRHPTDDEIGRPRTSRAYVRARAREGTHRGSHVLFLSASSASMGSSPPRRLRESGRSGALCDGGPLPTIGVSLSLRGAAPAATQEKGGLMFNVSRNVLLMLAVLALVLLILGLATDVGLIGWVLAVIVGAYVITAVTRQRRAV